MIEGLHSFKGALFHSASYEESFSLKDKRVAVIGVGSSGIQIISNIASEVKQLYSWVRSPTWITAGFAQRFAGPNGENTPCMCPSHSYFSILSITALE
jgi:cation diffusion facilitator CzcD-associated flavoprotein CzcO